MGMRQKTVNMDDDLENDIKELCKKDNNRAFAVMGYLLLQFAVKEKKRLAAKTKNKREVSDEIQ
jgi:hypothetical protein